MSISNEILKLIENGNNEWDEVYKELSKYHAKNSVSMAKKRLVQQGKIKEETINGKKILSIQDEKELISDVDAYIFEHISEIKEYFKHVLIQNHNNRVFSIKDFVMAFPHLASLNDIIVNHPFEARDIITHIYKETYEEIFAEKPDKLKINIINPLNSKKLSEIGANDIGKLVELECSIVQASNTKSRTTEAEYVCFECGATKNVKLDFWEDPEKKKVSCPKASCSNQRMAIDTKSRTTFQELIVQQEVSQDGKQHTQSLFLEDSPIYSGKIRVAAVPIEKRKKGTSVADIYLYAFGYEVMDNIDINITDDDIEKINKIAKDPEVIEKLANYMLRDTKGMDKVKKAIFLQQIKGVEKGNKRADIHILLITDPGIGKTVMLRRIAELPGNLYGSVTTASGVGLTAAVIREKTEIGGDTWVIKPGLLVKANKGTACIDEFTVNRDLQSFVLEAMESQTIHINKGGINAKLPSKCAILAACNPKLGRYDPNLSVMEQVPIKPEILSRFDLIFPLRDIPESTRDRDILKFIIRNGNEKIKGTEKKVKINGVELSDELLVKYLYYVDNYKPTISKKAEEIIIDFYLKMRKLSKNGAITITTRQAESLIRLSEAHAKARLKNEVDADDAREAIELMQFCLNHVSYDPEFGIDIDKVYGIPKSKREKSEQILKIIEDELHKCKDMVSEEIIFERAEMPVEDVERILELLSIRGDIYSPRFGYWRII